MLENLLLDWKVVLEDLDFVVYLANFDVAERLLPGADLTLFNEDVKATGECFLDM